LKDATAVDKSVKMAEAQLVKEVDILVQQIGRKVVSELSALYGFNKEDAEKALKLDKLRVDVIENKVKKKVTVVLPFCGEINRGCCYGIRLNHGLYTQCSNDITDTSGQEPLCGTCIKQVEKNSNGEPTYGYVTTRLEKGENFRDPKGKAPVNYGNIMDKLNITRDVAVKAATELGWTIPESQFQVKRATRGRPKKDATAVDTASEISEEDLPEKKVRGRPKKDKKIVSSNTGDDLIKDLVDKANKEPEPELSSNKESDDEEEAIQAKAIKMTKGGYIELDIEVEGESPAGTTHLINLIDNTLYDPKTYDNVGTWNPETKTIDPVDSDEE
jgi:hypothetical protein